MIESSDKSDDPPLPCGSARLPEHTYTECEYDGTEHYVTQHLLILMSKRCVQRLPDNTLVGTSLSTMLAFAMRMGACGRECLSMKVRNAGVKEWSNQKNADEESSAICHEFPIANQHPHTVRNRVADVKQWNGQPKAEVLR